MLGETDGEAAWVGADVGAAVEVGATVTAGAGDDATVAGPTAKCVVAYELP